MAVNFLRYRPGTRLSIPLEFINDELSVDVKRGSMVVVVNKYIDCICDGEIPKTIKIDMSNCKNGDVVRLNSIPFPPLVRPAKTVPPDFVACVVKVLKG